ncbi:hypothetical protein ABMA28_002160 [Loxostege sticticalis]|uniref:C2H2-type domain-containing protein n=1 Tax=Loxostege sticticalis TaxID=481309 RepID=A0ABD0T098_LOXSC
MSAQNIFNPNDFDAIETSPQMYYLQVEGQNIVDSPVDSQAIPLNMLLNSNNEHFLLPVMRGRQQSEQLCVYVEPTDLIDDQTLLNYISNQRYLPTNGNVNSLPATVESSSSSHILTNNSLLLTPSTSGKTSTVINTQDVVKSSKLPEKETKGKLSKNKVRGYVHFADRVVPPRAVAVLPAALQMRRGRVLPKRPLPERVRFGPVQGIVKNVLRSEARDMICDAVTSTTPIFLLKSGDTVKYIDVSDTDKSNWFSLLPLGTQSTANVWLYEEDNKLYGLTVQSVTPQTPLTLGYSKQYAQDHELPPGLPVLDLAQDLPELPRRWWCYECHRALPTASQLQLHVDIYHKEKITSMRRYRCRHCTRTFGRRFTLKRHIARYCCKKPEKTENLNKTITTPDIALNTSLNVEDNRLPSDESLQNYTNGLDFSTNLFDTDRMPGLDISGSSRSETEFNSYGIPYKDDTDLELGKLANDLDKTGNEDQDKRPPSTPNEPLTILISCPYCKQTIVREKKREHLRECSGKRFDCECGVTYDSAEKLAQHIHSVHLDKTTQTEQSESDQSKGWDYKCEKCQHTFKRRGMFVNHMWRVHKAATVIPLQRRVRHYPCGACPKLYRTAAKRDTHRAHHHPGTVAQHVSIRYMHVHPLQRRVRHYPCGACPKLYRTAAKRDTHRAHHHPGADLIRGQAIESGRRACEPAACEACPRQYATRAKLLQHVRQHHPHLAPPLQRHPKTKPHLQDHQKVSTKAAP